MITTEYSVAGPAHISIAIVADLHECHGPRKMRIECPVNNSVTRKRKGRPLLICLTNETSAW